MKEVVEISGIMESKDVGLAKLLKLQTLSVAVDMGEVSVNALRFAWEIAREMGSNLEVVYAMDSIFEGTQPSASGFLSGYSKTMHTELDAFIRETMEGLGIDYIPPLRFAGEPTESFEVKSDALQVVSKVIYGAPDIALTEYSRHTDLLIMGTTGRKSLEKKLFGSVSIEVSRNAHCPVLFVSAESAFKGFKQVLYASDIDSLDAPSVRQTVSFVRHFDGQIHFVHVGPGAEKNVEAQRAHFEACYNATDSDKPFIFTRMVSDDIVDALYEYAFYHRVDLMVFVTFHRAFWDGILHKSVTNEVLSSSNIPILVIHSDDDTP